MTRIALENRAKELGLRYPSMSAPSHLREYIDRKERMEDNGEQHTHEETVKDEHTNEDGTVKQETTETTEAETNGDE